MAYIQHFGVNVLEKSSGLKLTKENYVEKIIFKDTQLKNHFTNSIIQNYIEAYLYNFDLNMAYFRSLSKDEFNKKLDAFIEGNSGFIEIADLNAVDRTAGYYIMVLDEYAQVYIGTSQNIKKRIQEHWRMQMYFDRMIFSDLKNSILSINSFRALDTTRIFAYPTAETFILEDAFINQFDHKYLLNRTAGGALKDLSEAIAKRKTRDLSELNE